MYPIDGILWSLFKIALAIFLVFLNGFFVVAEFALVKVRRTRLAELVEHGSPRATTALDVTLNLDTYLSACQLGITLASLGLGWLGEPAIASLLEPLFSGVLGWSSAYTHTISLIIAFLTITFLHIVLGELVPKSLAIQSAEKMSLATAGILKLFYGIFYPVIWLLNTLATSVLRLWGVPSANEADLTHTEEELRMLVEASQRHGNLDAMEGTLLDNVFDFSDRLAGEVMVPRQDMICLYIQDSIDEVLKVVKEYGYTRYPLCDDDKDNVLGMIHIRDMLGIREAVPLQEISHFRRDILLVPEGIPISNLIQKMRSQRTHMAIVADEFGGTAGLVTMEDLIEELVGEIYDEFDREQPPIVKLNDTDYQFNGRVLLEEISEVLDIDLDEDGVTTIGGYIFSRMGRRPKKGDYVDFGGYTFLAEEVVGSRIVIVKALENQQQPTT